MWMMKSTTYRILATARSAGHDEGNPSSTSLEKDIADQVLEAEICFQFLFRSEVECRDFPQGLFSLHI